MTINLPRLSSHMESSFKKCVVPAYDLALATLTKDSLLLKAEAQQMRIDIEKKEANYQHLKSKLKNCRRTRKLLLKLLLYLKEKEIRWMKIADVGWGIREKANIIQIQSEVNLPNVRWKVNSAMGKFCFVKTSPLFQSDVFGIYVADMSNVSHRHFVEQKLRKRWRVGLACACPPHYPLS